MFCLCPFSFYFPCQAQVPSVIPFNGVVPAILNSTGGSYDNSLYYYRYEWGFGELLLVQAFAPADSSLLVTQGVLQPCTDKIGASPYIILFEAGDYKLFPNPTAGKFELDFLVRTPGLMSLQLINTAGQVLITKRYHYDGCCRIELFDIAAYPDGVYFIMADLRPDHNRPGDEMQVIRHSGFKVVKLNQQ